MPDKESNTTRPRTITTAKSDLCRLFPSGHTEEPGIIIHRRARFNPGKLDVGSEPESPITGERNRLYVVVRAGEVTVDVQTPSRRDGNGVWQTEGVCFKAAAHSFAYSWMPHGL